MEVIIISSDESDDDYFSDCVEETQKQPPPGASPFGLWASIGSLVQRIVDQVIQSSSLQPERLLW